MGAISYNKGEKIISKALKKLPPLKMIRPLKKLCTRLLNANEGLTVIHTKFLELCYKENVPREALDIMKTKCLPKRLSHVEYS